jgi:signal transduction histidine kinase
MKRSAFLFYFLSGYVLLQFAWWGFHIIQLSQQVAEKKQTGYNRLWMVLGEGMVFFLILIFGIWKLRSTIRKEFQLTRNQNNFLLSVTHELKTPIASNKLYLQTVLKRDLEPEKRKDLIEKALNENNRLEKMIDNILNASRLENQVLELHKESVNIGEFLLAIVDRFRKNNPEITFETRIDSTKTISVDPFVVETIINNLIENAIKYAGDAGPIMIDLSTHEKTKIRIIDRGIGIQVEDQKNMYKKFYRAGNEETRSKKGSGLGLFIASEFSKLHHGQLIYSTNKPSGAIFELIL